MTDQKFISHVVDLIRNHYEVDAIYLYGSRSQGRSRPDSDWDFAVLFKDFLHDAYERAMRPEEVSAMLEQTLKPTESISVVDLENVPPPLQYNIIRGDKIYDRNVPHVKRVEHGIISTIEKDYDDAA